MLNPNKDWTNYLPNEIDRQESQAPFVETNGCVPFSAIHNLEIQEKFLNGGDNLYAERALYQAIPVDPTRGSSFQACFNAIKANGLVNETDCPPMVNFTLAEWQAPIDPAILDTGKDWLKKWDVSLRYLDPKTCFSHLNESPIWITIDLNQGGLNPQLHAVVLINDHQYFDSYGAFVKPLNFNIVSAYQLLLTKKSMNLVNDNGTFYIVGNKGKIGIADIGALQKFQNVTDDVQEYSTASVPQVGVFKSDNLSVLVDN